ncbi:gastric inhibitory polypeptide receptor isoform X4 [Camelus ferus]|uniref:Gastric inhibitory polypeptide receptor isoform X4 n=1 Tax=Camelus ferus TaxID=419612 RepID=A0A8B8THF9_CAMFR|nr:gastric inhibitory polypeptide receptor isoform X4 [Camelus ferus]
MTLNCPPWRLLLLLSPWGPLLRRAEAGSEGQTAGELYQRWERYRRECQETLEAMEPPAGLACNGSFDMYVCWDYTAPNATARASCPWYLPWHRQVAAGFVLRQCGSDGQWGPWRDHSQCENPEKNGAFQDQRLILERLQVVYTVGYSLSFATLLFALLILSFFSHPHPRPSASSNWPLSWGSGPSPVESGPSCLSHSPGHDPVLRGRQLYVAAGGGHLPAQPPGPCGRLRGGPLPLLHARRLGCWERNDIKAIWWIIRTPILLTILVRPAPPPPGGLRDFPSWEARRYALFPRRFRAWVCLTLSLQINFIIFIRILGILVSKVRTRQMRCPDYRLRLARSTLTLVPLLGVHEVVFAPVTEEQARGTLRLAKLGFEIFLSSFQGFLVSILYCFINKEVQSEIRRGWHRCRLRHSLGGEEPRQPRERAFPTLSSGSGPGQVVAGRALCSRALPGPGVEASRVLESYC